MLKKISKLLLFSLALLLFASAFKTTDLTNRAIVLGLGVDIGEDGLYHTSAEVVVASNSSGSESSTSNGSRLIVGRGKSMALSINDMYQKAGRLPSLGHCGILILSDSVYKNENLKEVLSYFYLSDAFADSTLVSLCKGSAQEMLATQTPLDSYVAFALQTIIQVNGVKTNVPSNILQLFLEQMTTKSGASFLNVVEFIKADDKYSKNDEKSAKTSGYYDASKIAIFDRGAFVAVLNEEQTRGYHMLNKKKSFESFEVDAQAENGIFADKATLGIASKNVNIDCVFNDGKITVNTEIAVKLKRMQTDSSGDVIDLLPKHSLDVTEKMKQQVNMEIKQCVEAALKASQNYNCDYFAVFNKLYKKYGQEFAEFIKDKPQLIKSVELDVKVTAEG